MTVDDNKDIDITYNYLNLPVSIVRNTGSTGLIKHYYDGANKVRMEVYSDAAGSTLQKTYDYLGSSVYIKEAAEDPEMEFMGMPEGRVLFARKVLGEEEDPERGNIFKYEYQLRDHLGNLRVSCRCHEPKRDTSGDIIAEGETGHGFMDVAAVQFTEYDPWVLNFESPAVSSSEVENLQHRYLYNGKEQLQDLELGLYEYGFRWHDPAIGRFIQVDPLAMDYIYKSTYDYAENEPIAGIDIDGLERAFAPYPAPPDAYFKKGLQQMVQGWGTITDLFTFKAANTTKVIHGEYNRGPLTIQTSTAFKISFGLKTNLVNALSYVPKDNIVHTPLYKLDFGFSLQEQIQEKLSILLPTTGLTATYTNTTAVSGDTEDDNFYIFDNSQKASLSTTDPLSLGVFMQDANGNQSVGVEAKTKFKFLNIENETSVSSSIGL